MRSVTEPVDYKLKTTIFAEIYITRPERSEIYATKEKRMLCGESSRAKVGDQTMSQVQEACES